MNCALRSSSLIWREAFGQCHVDRAQLLKSLLLKAQRSVARITEYALIRNLSEASGVQSVVSGVYQRPYDILSTAAWNSALTTGSLAPMDRKRFDKLVALYTQIEYLNANRDREDHAAATLSALSLRIS